MNTVIACGGTGGHLFPGLAVAEVLRARGHEVMLFVSEKEIDSLAMTGREEFRFEKLPSVGFPSPFSPRIFGFFGRFAGGNLVAHDLDRAGRWADERHAPLGDRAAEISVFGEEPVAGMYRLGAAAFDGIENRRGVEVALGRRLPTEGIRLVGETHAARETTVCPGRRVT